MAAVLLSTLGLALPVFARALGLVITAPGWGLVGVGMRIRVVLAGLIACALLPAATRGQTDPAPHVAAVFSPLACCGELVIGVALGLAGALVVGAFRQAGELIALQAALSPASVLDMEPGVGEASTPFGQLFGIIAVTTYLAIGGPARLIEAFAQSYQAFPLGGVSFGDMTTTTLALDLFGRLGRALALAVQAASPVGLALLVAGFGMAWLARGGGLRSLGGLSWPTRWALGVGLTMLLLPSAVAIAQAAWGASFYWVNGLERAIP